MKMNFIKKIGIAVLAGILITQPIMTAVAPTYESFFCQTSRVGLHYNNRQGCSKY